MHLQEILLFMKPSGMQVSTLLHHHDVVLYRTPAVADGAYSLYCPPDPYHARHRLYHAPLTTPHHPSAARLPNPLRPSSPMSTLDVAHGAPRSGLFKSTQCPVGASYHFPYSLINTIDHQIPLYSPPAPARPAAPP